MVINLNQNSNIRRIDELGRIVIPKDIRKKLHIKDNELLEVYINNDEIHLKKYSALPDIIDYIKYLISMISRVTGSDYIVTDRDSIISATDETLVSKSLSSTLENIVLNGHVLKNDYIELEIAEGKKISGYVNLFPILIDTDRTGVVIGYSTVKDSKNEQILKILKNLIEEKLNNY